MSTIDLVGLIHRAVSAGITGVMLSVGHVLPAGPADPPPRAEDSRSTLPWDAAPWDGMPWDGMPWTGMPPDTPMDPVPLDPVPREPVPREPGPLDPAPVHPAPADPPRTDPAPVDPGIPPAGLPPGLPPTDHPPAARPPAAEPPVARPTVVTPTVVRPRPPVPPPDRSPDPGHRPPPPTTSPTTDRTTPPTGRPATTAAGTSPPAVTRPRTDTRLTDSRRTDDPRTPRSDTSGRAGEPAPDAPIRAAEFDTAPPARDVRSAGRVSVADGVLTLSSPSGAAALCWTGARTYGRWEVRMRAPASAGSALLVGTGPGAGQVRFVELAGSQARYVVRGDDGTARGSAPVDGSAWHVWTVEWTAESAVGLVDGREWFRADARALLPRGPLHLCLQAIRPEGARQGVATLEVDHVRDFAPRTR